MGTIARLAGSYGADQVVLGAFFQFTMLARASFINNISVRSATGDGSKPKNS